MLMIIKRQNRVWAARVTKTKDFDKLNQLTDFMVSHLYSLYDSIDEVEEFSEDWDYLSGSIDTTQVYLLKCGVEFMEHTAYIEYVDSLKWEKA